MTSSALGPTICLQKIIYSGKLKLYIYINISFIYLFNRVVIAAIVTALKINEDSIFKNKYYAKVGGIGANELSSLERFFLEGLDYHLLIDENDYTSLYNFFVVKAKERKLKLIENNRVINNSE